MMKAISFRFFTPHEWIILGFSIVGTVLALATLIVVRSVFGTFREELFFRLGDANTTLIAQMHELEQQVAILSLLLLILVVSLSFISGLIVWRNAKVSGPAS